MAEEEVVISDGKGLQQLFPGYYPPSKVQRQEVFQRGLVSFDANALLALYRFREHARNEFLKILQALQPRLFITHQAALEFYRNRLSVVEIRLKAPEQKCEEVDKLLGSVIGRINEFSNLYQIGPVEQKRLVDLVNELSAKLAESILAAGAYDLTREQVQTGTDSVVKRLEEIAKGRVGVELAEDDYKQAVKEATRRREARIPPGYADEKKATPELQAGDYILWRQLMNEALIHGRPVLFVSDEKKEDWVLRDSTGLILGPRPELVLEMATEAKVALHVVSVVGLLKEAPEYLGISVSSSTIKEAESIPERPIVGHQLTARSWQFYESLSALERSQFDAAIAKIEERIRNGEPILDPPQVDTPSRERNSYLLRWSEYGRAILKVMHDEKYRFETTIVIARIEWKKRADEVVAADD